MPDLTLQWNNDIRFEKHARVVLMCDHSVSNKTTNAFEFLTGTIESMLHGVTCNLDCE